MDFHPGGKSMLEQWAGKDCTDDFKQYHQDWESYLENSDYLRVGRVVSEKPTEAIGFDEVAIHGNIYHLRGEYPETLGACIFFLALFSPFEKAEKKKKKKLNPSKTTNKPGEQTWRTKTIFRLKTRKTFGEMCGNSGVQMPRISPPCDTTRRGQ